MITNNRTQIERSYLAIQSGTRNATLMMLLVQLVACCWVVTAVAFEAGAGGGDSDDDNGLDDDANPNTVNDTNTAASAAPHTGKVAAPAFPSVSRSCPWLILGACCGELSAYDAGERLGVPIPRAMLEWFTLLCSAPPPQPPATP